MKKTETLRQLADKENETRLTELSRQIATLRQARMDSAEQFATVLEPLAQAMAALTDETRETMCEIGIKGHQHSAKITQQIEAAAQVCQATAASAERSAQRLQESVSNVEKSHYRLALAVGVIASMLVSALWLWLGQ